MNLVLDISTSAEFWRRIYPIGRTPKYPVSRSSAVCAFTMEEIEPLMPSWMDEGFLEPIGGRIHVMAFDENKKRDSRRHVVHIWSGPIPDGSFFSLDRSVYIASPAFMFLVAASQLSVTQLIAFGCELCGLYSFDCSDKRGFRKRVAPLLTVERLKQYLVGAKGCRGYRKAMLALPHVVERSASPAETFDVMALCLPYRLGGYHLEKPLMNHKVPLTSRAARIARRQNCFPDMCYLKEKLDIEHHGKYDHSSIEDQASDRARVNALKEMGFEVIELTKDQVDDLQAFEYIAQRIARIIGKRLRKENLGPTEARLAFRRDVKAWNRSSGRLR